jgi:hypothetical protein
MQDLEALPELITKFRKNLRVFILDSGDKVFSQKVAKVSDNFTGMNALSYCTYCRIYKYCTCCCFSKISTFQPIKK